MIPILGPTETPIFDDLIIEQMESRLDDTIQCEVCENTAQFKVSHACCGFAVLICVPHMKNVEANAAADCASNPQMRCARCGTVFTNPTPETIYKVVPL